MNPIEEVLNRFGHEVVSRAKLNLYPGALKESIRYDLDVYKSNNFSLAFFMNEYGLFQDKGVSGVFRKFLTKFKYTTMRTASPNVAGSHAAGLLPWVRKKRIRLRDESGRFVKGTYENAAFVIARSIKKKGIRPTLFFTTPFEAAFADLPDEVVEAYGLLLDQALSTWAIKPNYKGFNKEILG